MITEFIVEEITDTIIVRVQLERATLSKATLFRETIEKLIDSGKRKLIIDCRNISFMDSTFLGSMVVSLKKMNALNGNFTIVFSEKSSLVLTMLESTKMIKIFTIFYSLEDALNSLDTK